MTCLTPPQTLADLVSVVTCAARAYGGSDWTTLSLIGLAGWCVLGIVGLGLYAAVRR